MRAAHSCASGVHVGERPALVSARHRIACARTQACLALAGIYFLDPLLFGRVVDTLGVSRADDAPR